MHYQTHPAVYRISMAADMLDLHPRTLRNYEKAGLVTPSRKGKWRYYSADDIAWIRCLFGMIHGGITIAAIGKLLHYAPCWEVGDCTGEKRRQCLVYQRRSREPAEGRGKLPAIIAATEPSCTNGRSVFAPEK